MCVSHIHVFWKKKDIHSLPYVGPCRLPDKCCFAGERGNEIPACPPSMVYVVLVQWAEKTSSLKGDLFIALVIRFGHCFFMYVQASHPVVEILNTYVSASTVFFFFFLSLSLFLTTMSLLLKPRPDTYLRGNL